MGRHRGATEIDSAQDEIARKRWDMSDLLPVTGEQAASVAGTEKSKMFVNFCQEIVFDRFGLFATFPSAYADEIDHDSMQARLVREGAPRGDWRWIWQSLHPLHYTGSWAPRVR
jgi:hypothetical protein